jgi:hypothetical protein
VSCSAVAACTAVGYFVNNARLKVTLAERWNGTSWSIQTTPNPNWAFESHLNGVSCTSPTACTAVGYSYYSPGYHQGTLAERWDGTRWSMEPTPNPPGATGGLLEAVSCTAATACTAVGSFANSASPVVTLAERWDGTNWSYQPTPNPTGANGSFLNGVSCTSTNACTAVGYSVNANNWLPLAERWNGTSWSIQTTPLPAGDTTYGVFAGVSCTSANACTAVGSFIGCCGFLVELAERWDGTSWSIQPTPDPDPIVDDSLNAVSCTSANACTAVGSYDGLTLGERWDGTSWSTQQTLNSSGATSITALSGVSCASTMACIAVGAGRASGEPTLTVAESWNGTSWSVSPTANPIGPTSSALYGVSCASPVACTAVGYDRSTAASVAERWNGTSWAIEPTPRSQSGRFLEGVSCTSTTACTAVGGGDGTTLAERWNGTSWSAQTTPNPGQNFDRLVGVSCVSTTACMAVGGGESHETAEAWNGTSWSILPTPNPAVGMTLSGVSCTSMTACAAVGGGPAGGGVFYTLAEAWNGTSWSREPLPNPTGLVIGVSCTSATACTAVGYSIKSSAAGDQELTLAERWNGTSWSVEPTPNPTGGGQLNAVSCTSTTSCVAVGYSWPGERPLVERWNGTSWSIQTTPNPTGGQLLYGVSCTSTTACTATGYLNTQFQLPLAERYS